MSWHKNLIAKFKAKELLVIGDCILDQHIQGTVSRISPEAPVPIVLQEGEPTFAPGGAANVAANLRNLGANVTMLGRIGPDPEGKMFLKMLQKNKIPVKGIFVDKAAPTILKTRIMARHQQILRVDREQVNAPLNGKTLDKTLEYLQKHIEDFDAVILSDYGKGMITQPLVEAACTLAKKNKTILTVDPKVEHFAYYRGVTAITPNKKEAENAIRNIKITQSGRRNLALNSDRLETYKDVERAGRQLLKYLGLQCLMITLGEEGVCLLEKGKDPRHIPTRAQDVFDVTGAGDTVISVFTLALASGATKRQAADLANHAAGVVVGKMGAVAVTKEELLKSMAGVP